MGATLAPFTKREKPQLSSSLAVDFIKKRWSSSGFVDAHRDEGGVAGLRGGLQDSVSMNNIVEFSAFPPATKARCRPDVEKAATP